MNPHEMEKAIELIRSAEINLDNLAKMVPGLSEHPMFKVVKMQLGWAIEEIGPTRQEKPEHHDGAVD